MGGTAPDVMEKGGRSAGPSTGCGVTGCNIGMVPDYHEGVQPGEGGLVQAVFFFLFSKIVDRPRSR